MCRLWTAPRGTTVAQLMQSMRKAVAGSLRFGKRGRVFDKGVVARKAGGSMALSRSLAGRARRERGEFRRRIYAARTRLAARPAAGIGPAVYQGRGAEPDPEFQSAGHDRGSVDGQRTGCQETRSAIGW